MVEQKPSEKTKQINWFIVGINGFVALIVMVHLYNAVDWRDLMPDFSSANSPSAVATFDARIESYLTTEIDTWRALKEKLWVTQSYVEAALEVSADEILEGIGDNRYLIDIYLASVTFEESEAFIRVLDDSEVAAVSHAASHDIFAQQQRRVETLLPLLNDQAHRAFSRTVRLLMNPAVQREINTFCLTDTRLTPRSIWAGEKCNVRLPLDLAGADAQILRESGAVQMALKTLQQELKTQVTLISGAIDAATHAREQVRTKS